MHSLLRYGAAGLFAAAVSAGPAFADIVFTDNTFNLANYSKSPTFTSDPSASIATSSSGGTLALTSTFTSNTALFTTSQGLVNNFFAINPAVEGAITSIDASVVKNLSVNFTGTGFGNTFHPTIEQGGVFYIASIPGPALNGPGSTGFNTLAQTGLTAASFLSYNFATGVTGTANPNFDGGTMLFGLTQITGVAGVTGIVTAQYEDLNLDVHGANAVPEPSTIALFGAGLLGLGWLYRRKTA